MRLSIDLPPLHASTKLTVVIPARDESRSLPDTLDALAQQCTFDGKPIDADTFDIIVLANNCRDDTAKVARDFGTAHTRPTTVVAEIDVPEPFAHVGTARRLLMESAANRFLRAKQPLGIIASTDADTRVHRTWVAAIIDEMRAADAVTGRIRIATAELAALDPATRLLYLRDQIYRRLVSELDAIYDPVAHDPLPRHGQHFGASFAVTADAYRRAGGVPPRARHEDIAFYEALDRIDARVRHSMRVSVATSARFDARAHGGFATFLGGLRDQSGICVEDPALTVLRLQTRPLLRKLWRRDGSDADLARARTTYGTTKSDWDEIFRAHETFGDNLWRIERFAASHWTRYRPVEIEKAIPVIRTLHATSR